MCRVCAGPFMNLTRGSEKEALQSFCLQLQRAN